MSNLITTRLLSQPRFGLFDRIILPVLAVLGVATVVAVIFVPDGTTARYFHDDAFFVLKTAFHIGSGDGSTFDGVNLTNGYHPLNTWLLAVFSFIVPIKGGVGLDAVILINMTMTAVGLVVINQFAKAAGFSGFSRIFMLIAVSSALAFNDFGLEARLLLPAAWLFLLFAYRAISSGQSNNLVLGFLGATVALTRLDATLFVVIIIFSVSVWLEQPLSRGVFTGKTLRPVISRFVSMTVIPAVALAGYSIYNWIAFSKPMTVTSWLKFGSPMTWELSWLHHPGAYGRFGLCLVVAVAFFLIVAYIRSTGFKSNRPALTQPALQWLLAFANLYSVLHLLSIVLFLRGDFGSWYLALPLSIAVVTSAYLMTIIFERLESTAFGLPQVLTAAQIFMILIVLAGGVLFATSKVYRGGRDDAIAMGLWVKDNLPKDARIFQVDASGFTAYFSERSVINGDGLINSWDYQDALRNDRLPEYLRDRNVRYVIWSRYAGQPKIDIAVKLWTEPDHSLTFSKEPERIADFGRFLLAAVDSSTAVVLKP